MGRILIRASIYERIRDIGMGGVYDMGKGVESEV
jgi:hypothetical protein